MAEFARRRIWPESMGSRSTVSTNSWISQFRRESWPSNCVIMGDSIAVGVGMYRPDCATVARSGITSARYIAAMLTPQDANTIAIDSKVTGGQPPAGGGK